MRIIQPEGCRVHKEVKVTQPRESYRECDKKAEIRTVFTLC